MRAQELTGTTLFEVALGEDKPVVGLYHRLKTLTADIHKMRPTIAIRERVFLDEFDGYRILVREVEETENVLRDVTIYAIDPREPTKTIHAPRGELLYGDDGNKLIIRRRRSRK